MNSIKNKASCRACGSSSLGEILNLGEQPPANAYIANLGQPEQAYPLSLQLCQECGMVQLGHVVDPDILFSNYAFRTSSSPKMVEYFVKLMESSVEHLEKDDLLVEIGANDGHAISSLSEKVRILGIDPAGIPSPAPMLTAKFNTETARQVLENEGQASVIVACNVLAHVDEVDEFIEGVRLLLKDDGNFIFEVPYIGDFLDKNEFDTIYHEHLSYFSVGTLNLILKRHGFNISRIDASPVHGGSIRVSCSKNCEQWSNYDRWMASHELWRELKNPGTYRTLSQGVASAKTRLRGLLENAKHQGKRVIGYGAAAKATVRLNACEIGTDLLGSIIDSTPEKHGKLVPGTHQKIVSPQSVDLKDYDIAVIFPANHEAEITKRIVEAGFCGEITLA